MLQQVTYRDNDHTYWCGTKRYISATQVLDLFKNKFDVNGQAIRFAEKHGADADTWKERWDDTRKRSLVRGNRIHNQREELTLSRGMEVHQGKVLPVPNPALYGDRTPLIQMPDGIYTEQLLYSHHYGIAGRCDKLVITSTPRYRTADIDDYKSNRILRTRSYCYKDGTRQMMLPPIAHLEDCSMVHYELQTSLYLLMAEELGFIAGTGRIIHYPHVPLMAPEGALPPLPKTYTVQYRKNDVISMLQQLNNG